MAILKYSDGPGIPNQYPFNTAQNVSINHGLGYNPQVWIVIGGIQVYGQITYNNNASFTVTFSSVESGVIYYR